MKPQNAIKWSFGTQITQFTIYFIVNVTLSRILAPSDFGTYAIINIFIGFLSTIRDFGVGSFLINQQELTREKKNTVFFINLVIVSFLCILLIGSSGLIADFYQDERLKIFLSLCALSLFIDGLAVIPDSILHKSMSFHHLFVSRSVSQITGGTIAIVLALRGWGIYSLVFQSIGTSLLSFSLLYYFYPFIPSFQIDKNILKRIFSFSGPVFLDSVVQYWTRNIDNLLVGKVFGPTTLGIYNRAYTLMQLPTSNLSSVVSRVLFPYLSKNQYDRSSVTSIYLKTIKSIAMVAFPVMGLLYLCSEDIIMIFYGEKWMDVVPILKIFAIAGAIESILYPTGSLFLAYGKTSKMLRINSVVRGIIILFIVFGTFYSVKFIAICYLIATLITMPIVLQACCSLLGIRLTHVFRELLPVVLITFTSTAVAMAFVSLVLPENMFFIVRVALISAIFGLTYISLIFKFSKNSFIALFKL